MGSSKEDAEHEFISEHAITFDLSSVSTKELVEELRKREGVTGFDVTPEGEYGIRVEDDTYSDIVESSGPAILLRIID